jgi:predicted proteasome-type protease
MEGKMKQNITISLEKEFIKKAKILAALKETSVTRLLSEELKQLVQKEEHYQQAKKKALALLNSGFHLGGKIKATREELHAR